jgi:hypothetical protein
LPTGSEHCRCGSGLAVGGQAIEEVLGRTQRCPQRRERGGNAVSLTLKQVEQEGVWAHDFDAEGGESANAEVANVVRHNADDARRAKYAKLESLRGLARISATGSVRTWP